MEPFAKIAFCIPIVLTACSGESQPSAGVEADASDDIVSVEAGVDTALDQNSDTTAIDAGVDGTEGGCAPRSDGSCESLGIHLCCGLSGKAYQWDGENQCKVEIGPPAGEPVLCLEGNTLEGPQVACTGYPVLTCYERTNADGTMTVYLTGSDLDSDYFEGTGLVRCDPLFFETVTAAPQC